MADELEEQLEAFLEQVESRIPTLEQKKRITKAGAKVYKKALKENTPTSGHKENKHVVDSLKQSTDGATGNSSVFFSAKKGDKGYIARLLNDGYMSHGGKGKSAHTVKFIPGRHFVETTYLETQPKILEAMKQAYDEEMRRK
ncbi:phage protein, HK97 gp10 family [Enterococcus faecalis]|uniref:HK97-gp10 family putative phage morphogenesis protein n=1 Tax=Enterococcus TaxID=1350 RepID=UPI000459B3C1|nr:HK97-gp10 family putative phage morphogenesis protein [Enterococcus faecalis]KAJ80416.1 Phage head-tail joining protein [Enterococcus faecalis MTUP9]SDN56679.1 phage protein, HK97 gp10 family [Enterococcus faecalis]